MSNELILPLTHRSPLSVDYTTTAALSRGDLVELPGGPGFALADANANTTVAVGVQSPMVSIAQPATPRAWKAGELVYLNADNEFVSRTNIAKWLIGWVHEDTSADAKRVPVVWSPSEGHFHLMLDEDTTPKFGMTSVTSGNQIPSGSVDTHRLCQTTTKGIRSGAPVRFDFDGSLLWQGNADHVAELTFILTFWYGIDAKQIVKRTSTYHQARQNRSEGTVLSGFSQTIMFTVGSDIEDDVTANRATTITAQDFEDGIPLQVDFEFAPRVRNDYTTAHADQVNVNPIHMLHPHMIISQSGRALQ